jgi:hypothetical protein
MRLERERQPYTAKEGTGKIYERKQQREQQQDQPRAPASHRMSMSNSAAVPPPLASVPPQNFNGRETAGLTRSTSRAAEPPPQRNRERAQSNAAPYAGSSSKRSTSGRSPPPSVAQQSQGSNGGAYYPGHIHGPGGPHSGLNSDDERFYFERERDPDRSDPEAERRFARYNEEYRKERVGEWSGNGNGSVYGNPPLGTGERRYG